MTLTTIPKRSRLRLAVKRLTKPVKSSAICLLTKCLRQIRHVFAHNRQEVALLGHVAARIIDGALDTKLLETLDVLL